MRAKLEGACTILKRFARELETASNHPDCYDRALNATRPLFSLIEDNPLSRQAQNFSRAVLNILKSARDNIGLRFQSFMRLINSGEDAEALLKIFRSLD